MTCVTLQLSCFQMFVMILPLSHLFNLSVEKYSGSAQQQDDARADIHAHEF